MDWSNAKSLSDLGELTSRWLTGEISTCPSQSAPPDCETGKIVKYLIAINKLGFVTDFSQPAGKFDNGYAQRACVSGFCSESHALAVAGLTLSTNLIVHAFPPNQSGGYQIPITIVDYHPFTWHGLHSPEDCYEMVVNPDAINELLRSWYLIVIDPNWGRQQFLWTHTLKAMGEDNCLFDSRPSPDLNLDVDFVF
ncbi:MAG: hypothetical protein WCG34_11635 [Leptolinea sp.]